MSYTAHRQFHFDDPLLLEEQLIGEEKMLRDAARDYAQGSLAPRIVEAFRNEHADPAISQKWEVRVFHLGTRGSLPIKNLHLCLQTRNAAALL